MLCEIKLGDKLKCMNCKKMIEISKETFKHDAVGEYIFCPHCETGTDTIVYHKFGKRWKDE